MDLPGLKWRSWAARPSLPDMKKEKGSGDIYRFLFFLDFRSGSTFFAFVDERLTLAPALQLHNALSTSDGVIISEEEDNS